MKLNQSTRKNMDPNVKNKSGDSFCALAWIHTSSEPYGTCRSCCIARDHITKEDGKIYSLAEDTVSDILNSTYMKKLRTAMRNGDKPLQCETCWEDEANGKESKRLMYNKMVKDINKRWSVLEDAEYDREKLLIKEIQRQKNLERMAKTFNSKVQIGRDTSELQSQAYPSRMPSSA